MEEPENPLLALKRLLMLWSPFKVIPEINITSNSDPFCLSSIDFVLSSYQSDVCPSHTHMSYKSRENGKFCKDSYYLCVSVCVYASGLCSPQYAAV